MIKFIPILLIFNIVFTQALTNLSFIGTKSMGLAGAVVSSPNDGDAAFYNPASLKSGFRESKTSFLMGSSKLYNLNFLEHQYLSINFSSGVSLSFQHLGTENKRSNFSLSGEFSQYGFIEPDEYLSKERSYSLSQGISLLNDNNSTISIGYNLNYFQIYQNKSAGPNGDGQNGLPSKHTTAYGVDIGFLASLRDKVSFGVFVKNITNTKISRGDASVHLPRKLNLGITYYPFQNLITTFSLNRVLGNDENSFRFGIEYNITQSFLWRSGIQINPNRFGAGFAYNFSNDFEIAYSVLTHSVLPLTSVFNLKIYFE